MEVFFCTDLQAIPVQILPCVVMCWEVEATLEEARARLGVETQRRWSARRLPAPSSSSWLCSRSALCWRSC
jgi:hypothetical protein